MESIKTAKDIASGSLYFIDGLATVRDAINLMNEKSVDFLFIKKRNDHDANGIIVISDIIKGVVVKELKADEVSIYEIMTKPVISIPASMNSKYASRLLLNSKINVAPVEENGAYIGVIHLRDVVMNY
jgi:signal-transduction protein with cAMP-binding, CBS, and nucleotidyltransferase domain